MDEYFFFQLKLHSFRSLRMEGSAVDDERCDDVYVNRNSQVCMSYCS